MDKLEIREAIENWAIWRDAGNWDRFRTLWHPEGRMSATWFFGSSELFIERASASMAAGVIGHHYLGGSSIEIKDSRAIAQTKMTAAARAPVDGVLCDATTFGRFYDFFEKREGKWAIVLRQPIYEKDRLDPVDCTEKVICDPEILQRFPQAYCHLAYAQTKVGLTVNPQLPTLTGPLVEQLYRDGAAWLDGKPLNR